MKVVLAETAGRKSVAGASSPTEYSLSLLPICSSSPVCVHLLSGALSMLLFPFAIDCPSLSPCLDPSPSCSYRSQTFSRWFYLRLISSLSSLLLHRFFFCIFQLTLPRSSLTLSAFLLARLTKMGPAASGSRFPRKLSSYKINYPPYFIAPRRFGSGCARQSLSLSLFLSSRESSEKISASDNICSLY